MPHALIRIIEKIKNHTGMHIVVNENISYNISILKNK